MATAKHDSTHADVAALKQHVAILTQTVMAILQRLGQAGQQAPPRPPMPQQQGPNPAAIAQMIAAKRAQMGAPQGPPMGAPPGGMRPPGMAMGGQMGMMHRPMMPHPGMMTHPMAAQLQPVMGGGSSLTTGMPVHMGAMR